MIVIGNLLFNPIPVIKPVGSGNNIMHIGDRQIRQYEPSGKIELWEICREGFKVYSYAGRAV